MTLIEWRQPGEPKLMASPQTAAGALRSEDERCVCYGQQNRRRYSVQMSAILTRRTYHCLSVCGTSTLVGKVTTSFNGR